MMLALLTYCYAIGISSSRRIERATWRDMECASLRRTCTRTTT